MKIPLINKELTFKPMDKAVTGTRSIDDVGWHDINGSYLPNDHNDFENSFDNVVALAFQIMMAQPYLIDKNQEPLKQDHQIQNVLNSPHKRMSALEFRLSLASKWLTQDETYVRVLHKGNKVRGNINPNNITGFEFLENVTPIKDGNLLRFELYDSGLTIYDDEVLIIPSFRNPDKSKEGFSPTRAARRWTRIDDYIADYQAGFFLNGAVPAGRFIITANSIKEFKELKKMMENRHRGAQANNNIQYDYRPAKLGNGKQHLDPIEWVPYHTQNKDLALKDLINAVDKKKDSAFGVPAEMRGDLKNSNYASAYTAERVMINNRVRPIALLLWDRFTHELIRITGGFEAAITFDIESPSIADEEHKKAQAKKVDADTILALTKAGASLKSIVMAFDYPDSYTKLKFEEAQTTNTQTNNDHDKPPVADEETTEDQENQDNEKSKAKASKALEESDRIRYEHEIQTTVQSQINRQINRAVDALDASDKAVEDPTNEEEEQLEEELYTTLATLVAIYGITSLARGMALLIEAGLPTNAIDGFTMSAAQTTQYRQYLKQIVSNFNDETAQRIRDILANGIENELTKAQIRSQLRDMGLDSYRARRLAISEVNRAQNRASNAAMQMIQEATGVRIKKRWVAKGPDPCPLCLSLNGREEYVEDVFWPKDGVITGNDGKEYTNTFIDAHTADAHPFCHCEEEYYIAEG